MEGKWEECIFFFLFFLIYTSGIFLGAILKVEDLYAYTKIFQTYL